MIKCIIFDCDGTLVDSEVLCNRALSIKLEELGIKLTTQALLQRFRGAKLSAILASIQSEFNCDIDDNFVLSYRQLVSNFFENELKPCPGVKEALSQINLPMCVASNGPLSKMQQALSTSNLLPYFNDHLFSAYDLKSWKPDPDLFLFAAKKMGFKPVECLVVEDSMVGIEAANAAHMPALLYDPNKRYPKLNTKRIDRFIELLNHLH